MDLSFVILTWNSEKYIRTCVESIFEDAGQEGLSFEIWIVDNGSSDRTPTLVRQSAECYPKVVQSIFLKKNHGTTVSRNLALKKAAGATVVILDSDAMLLQGTTRGLLTTLYSDSDIGLVAPRLIYPNGSYQKSVDAFPTLHHKFKRFFYLRSMEKLESQIASLSTPVAVDYAISALWFIKREVIRQVGLLDEKIFYSPEDVDYCLRTWKAGHRVVYDPRWTAIHDAQEISRGFRLNGTAFLHFWGLLYFFNKHGYCFNRPNRLAWMLNRSCQTISHSSPKAV